MREIRQADLTAALDEMGLPALVVWGEHDALIDPAIGRELAASLPQADFHLIAGAGHNPMWDRPHHFNEAVLTFLREGQP
jgi:pimeloyl-ACP methyl ester carboxylesterase